MKLLVHWKEHQARGMLRNVIGGGDGWAEKVWGGQGIVLSTKLASLQKGHTASYIS